MDLQLTSDFTLSQLPSVSLVYAELISGVFHFILKRTKFKVGGDRKKNQNSRPIITLTWNEVMKTILFLHNSWQDIMKPDFREVEGNRRPPQQKGWETAKAMRYFSYAHYGVFGFFQIVLFCYQFDTIIIEIFILV